MDDTNSAPSFCTLNEKFWGIGNLSTTPVELELRIPSVEVTTGKFFRYLTDYEQGHRNEHISAVVNGDARFPFGSSNIYRSIPVEVRREKFLHDLTHRRYLMQKEIMKARDDALEEFWTNVENNEAEYSMNDASTLETCISNDYDNAMKVLRNWYKYASAKEYVFDAPDEETWTILSNFKNIMLNAGLGTMISARTEDDLYPNNGLLRDVSSNRTICPQLRFNDEDWDNLTHHPFVFSEEWTRKLLVCELFCVRGVHLFRHPDTTLRPPSCSIDLIYGAVPVIPECQDAIQEYFKDPYKTLVHNILTRPFSVRDDRPRTLILSEIGLDYTRGMPELRDWCKNYLLWAVRSTPTHFDKIIVVCDDYKNNANILATILNDKPADRMDVVEPVEMPPSILVKQPSGEKQKRRVQFAGNLKEAPERHKPPPRMRRVESSSSDAQAKPYGCFVQPHKITLVPYRGSFSTPSTKADEEEEEEDEEVSMIPDIRLFESTSRRMSIVPSVQPTDEEEEDEEISVIPSTRQPTEEEEEEEEISVMKSSSSIPVKDWYTHAHKVLNVPDELWHGNSKNPIWNIRPSDAMRRRRKLAVNIQECAPREVQKRRWNQ